VGTKPSDRIGLTARIIASVWTALFLLLALGYAMVDDPNQSEDTADLLMDTILMALFLAAALGACVLSWARTSLSVPLFIAIALAGAIIGIITAGENHWIAALVSGGPYLLAAAIAWFSTDSPRHRNT
jgi:hypothetical protein